MATKYLRDANGNYLRDANGKLLTVSSDGGEPVYIIASKADDAIGDIEINDTYIGFSDSYEEEYSNGHYEYCSREMHIPIVAGAGIELVDEGGYVSINATNPFPVMINYEGDGNFSQTIASIFLTPDGECYGHGVLYLGNYDSELSDRFQICDIYGDGFMEIPAGHYSADISTSYITLTNMQNGNRQVIHMDDALEGYVSNKSFVTGYIQIYGTV